MDIERLIEEVEKRPVLYDSRIAGYTRKELKPKLWSEVARAVSQDWAHLSKSVKQDRVVEVQKRWRTLRDNFKRELNYQRSVEIGEIQPTKRKKYIYYDLLQFLEPVMTSSRYSDYKRVYKLEGEELEELALNGLYEGEDETGLEGIVCDEGILGVGGDGGMIGEEEAGMADSDQMFLLSLLPGLKRLDHEARSLARMRILQAVHEVTYSGGSGGVGGSSTNPSHAVNPPSHINCQHVVGPIVVNCSSCCAGSGAQDQGPLSAATGARTSTPPATPAPTTPA